MLRRDIGPVTVMGFARYSAKPEVDPAELIAAARIWQQEFLANQPGIAMHCFLGNLKGEFADAILATDEASFIAMAQEHPKAPSSAPLMEMLDVGTIRLTKNNLLGGVKSVPRGFAAVEFGTFSVRDKTAFSEDELVVASDKMEAGYLSHFDATKAHFMGRIDDQTYSEITFAETTGTALHMREGYAENETCRALLEFAAPETVDIDLWHLLA